MPDHRNLDNRPIGEPSLDQPEPKQVWVSPDKVLQDRFLVLCTRGDSILARLQNVHANHPRATPFTELHARIIEQAFANAADSLASMERILGIEE